MLTRGSWAVKFLAPMLVCGFLLGVSTAGAAASAPNQSKNLSAVKDSSASPTLGHPRPAAGPNEPGVEGFLRALGSGYCQSSCCYASGCDSVSCSDTSCSATCGGSSAVYNCTLNAD
jgi:hypothetical protein